MWNDIKPFLIQTEVVKRSTANSIMALYLLILALNLAVGSAMYSWELPRTGLDELLSQDLDERWIVYKKAHNKTYDAAQEELLRRVYWEDTVRYIDLHNRKYEAGESTFYLRENFMSDLSTDEYQKIFTSGLEIPEEGSEYYPEPLTEDDPEAADEVDWRKKSVVTPVQHQGYCGSCWAFSALASLESIHAIKNRQRASTSSYLSPQNLVDCTRNAKYRNGGCRGGWMNAAFQYIKDNHGVNTQRCYRYTGRDGSCRYNRRPECIGARVKGYSNVGKSEPSLDQALNKKGPVSVAMDCTSRAFQSYGGGVYNNPYCDPRRTSHAMAAVGYSKGGRYYIIKNSWGTGWGERGYLRLKRGSRCGVADFASYPLV